MNAHDILPSVNSHDTNNSPAVDDKAALAGVDYIVGFFNSNLKAYIQGEM